MTDDRKLRPEDEAGLEERGDEAVRILLATAAPDPGTRVEGLFGPGGKYIIRRDAELWLRRRDAERAEILAQKEVEAARFNRTMRVLGSHELGQAAVGSIVRR